MVRSYLTLHKYNVRSIFIVSVDLSTYDQENPAHQEAVLDILCGYDSDLEVLDLTDDEVEVASTPKKPTRIGK